MFKVNRKVCVAPMMDCTDRHDRYFLRLISKNVMLYSEMIATGAILKGKQRNVLEFNEFEKPVALQLGGSSAKELGESAKIAEDYNYDEINLNLGCPSKKVQKNKFGACLIKEPDLVAECLNSMVNATKLPVTVKTRIGFDDVEDFEYLDKFIKKIASTGVKTVILHARKAILKGLSPRDNLRVPKLNYEIVKQIKDSNPNLEIVINGGITRTEEIKEHLKNVDGVMIGRSIYHSPYFLAEIEKEIFNNEDVPTREEVVKKIVEYCLVEVKKGTRVNQIMRHTVGLFHGINGANYWKRYLSNNMLVRDADVNKVNYMLDMVKHNSVNVVEKNYFLFFIFNKFTMLFFKRLFSSSNLELKINDGGRAAAGYKGQAGDCVVRSIAIATGMPYQKVYDDLFKANQEFRNTSRTKLARSLKQRHDTPRTGTHRAVLNKYLEKLGWKWTPTMFVGQGCKVHLKKEELPMGTLIVSCSKHLTVVIDGVLNDIFDCSRNGTRCVYGYWTKGN